MIKPHYWTDLRHESKKDHSRFHVRYLNSLTEEAGQMRDADELVAYCYERGF